LSKSVEQIRLGSSGPQWGHSFPRWSPMMLPCADPLRTRCKYSRPSANKNAVSPYLWPSVTAASWLSVWEPKSKRA